MNWLEKIYRERFQNQTSVDGVDVDELWSGIESALAEQERKSLFTRKTTGYSLLAVVALFFLAWACWPKHGVSTNSHAKIEKNEINKYSGSKKSKDSNNSKEEINAVKLTDSELSSSGHSDTLNETIEELNTIQKSSSRNERIRPYENLTADQKKYTMIDTEDGGPTRSERTSLNLTTHTTSETNLQKTLEENIQSEEIELLEKQSIPFNQVVNIHVDQSVISDDKSNKKSGSQENSEITKQRINLNPLPLKKYALLREIMPEPYKINTSIEVLPEFQRRKDSGKEQSTGIWSIGIYSGINTINQGFSSTTNTAFVDELNNALSPELGAQVGLALRYNLTEMIYIGAGLEYTQTENRFDYRLIKDTMIIDVRNQRGELIRGQKIRTVVNHNKLSYLSIPVELGINVKKNNWRFGAAVGLSYSILIDQDGKILSSDDEILSYDGSALTQLHSNNFLSVGVNPFIQYDLGERIGFRINTAIHHQLHGNSTLIGENHRVWRIAPSLGLAFRL